MILETFKALKDVEERIRILELRIADAQGINSRMPQGILSSGFRDPTQTRAIRSAALREQLSLAEQERDRICRSLYKEKEKCTNDLIWKLLWDHYYAGYSWKKTALRHTMKESAAKMRCMRFLKNYEGTAAAAVQAGCL